MAGGSLQAQSSGEAGSLDTSFSDHGFATTAIRRNAEAHAVAVQPDGKILAARFSDGGRGHDLIVVRYTAAGSLDTSFGNGGIATTAIGSGSDDNGEAVAVRSDGKVVVAGRSNATATVRDNSLVVRYTAAGALDTTFESNEQPLGGEGSTPCEEGKTEPRGQKASLSLAWASSAMTSVRRWRCSSTGRSSWPALVTTRYLSNTLGAR